MVRAAWLAALGVGLALLQPGVQSAEVQVGPFGITVSDGPRVSGSGKRGEETRTLPAFSALVLDAPVDVTLKAGNVERATLRADDNLLSRIETRVVDGRLEIALKRRALFSIGHRAEVTVEFKQLNAIRIASSGNVHADAIRAPVLEIAIGGSGGARIDRVDVDALAVSVAGSGDVRAAGRAASVGIVIGGSGEVDVSAVQAGRAGVRIAGSGNVLVSADDTLDVQIDGSGDVRYRGAPRITKTIRGSGAVVPLR